MDGTYPLPEAQRDRFTARISIGYPDPAAELAVLDEHSAADPLVALRPVSDARAITGAIAGVRQVHVATDVRRYAVDLVASTRRLPEVRLGASPRATLHLVRAAKAKAAIAGRDYVVPDDVRALAQPVLAHRLLPSAEAAMSGRPTTSILESIVAEVPVPEGRREG